MLIISFIISSFIKYLQVIIISAVKFIVAAPVSLQYGFNYLETFLTTTLGGIIGILFFYYLSGWLIKKTKIFFPIIKNKFNFLFHKVTKSPLNVKVDKPAKRKVFTFRNKLIARYKNNFGFFGIILFTPVFFSIPLGSFLANKYYSNKHNILTYLTLSVVFWAFILSSFYLVFKVK